MAVPLLTTGQLRKIRRRLRVPFDLELKSGSRLRIEEVLRLLPGKRLTARARFEGRTVLAKIFFARSGACRHLHREKKGFLLLAARGLPCPTFLGSHELAGGGLLLTEFLDRATSLGDQWQNPADEKTDSSLQKSLLEPLFALVGTMHAAGLGQKDLHLGNFLHHEGILKIIDGDGIFFCRKQASQTANLGLLMAQLPVALSASLAEELLAAYHKGLGSRTVSREDLERATRRQRDRRLKAYLRKSLRDCGEFIANKTPCKFFSLVRTEASRLAQFLKNPDQAMSAGVALKLGNSCTLVRLDLHGKEVVIKRYNTVSAFRYVKRCWRRTRAMKSWLSGHRLKMLGIATPRPLALFEERAWFLRGRAWLLCEHIDGENLLSLLSGEDKEPPTALMEALKNIFTAMYDARITHGDMKGTNFLWYDERIHLVDLDAMRVHRLEFTFKRAWERDRRRFLRNWDRGSITYQLMDEIFPRLE